MSRSFLAKWRNAVRDSDLLDAPAKLVAFALSTYMDSEGRAWPAKATLARNSSLSARTVDRAISKLETHAFLLVTRATSYRRGGNKYRAAIPNSVTGADSETRATTRTKRPVLTREVIKARDSGVADSPSEAAARWWEKTGRLMSPDDAEHMLSNHFGLTEAEYQTLFQVAA